MSNNYEDEIDLYGDAEEPQQQQQQQQRNSGSSSNNNNNNNNNASSSIPTFISEARGGTGVIPPRDDERNRQGSSDGLAPRNGDYGEPGQWKTKPISTVRPSDMPEEGKMFVGGLNWETTEESMKAYFEQFGEVTHCTIMRDPQTNRSRGFGFLTFAEAAAVNVVMVKEHHLDGKIIDPKRAIPRPDVGTVRQDKVFVRHVPQSMDFYKFKEYFSQYGAIVDCNLMFDRETGMHRGFGFVTYEDPSSVSTALSQGHEWDGQQLEVKMATQKRNREDTYVGDRPLHRRQQFDNRNDGPMGGNQMMMGNQMGGNMGGMNMGGGGGMGGMGMNMPGAGMGNMGGMGMQGGMQGGMGQQGGFDPFAMAQFFKQMGWGQFNPMMLMNGGMGGGAMGGGAGNGMMDQSMMNPMMAAMMNGMGGMNNNMGMGGGMGNMGNNMGMMGGAQSPSGSSGGFGDKAPPTGPRAQSSQSGRMSDNKPPANAPTGPRGGSAAASSGAAPSSSSGTGPMRNQRNQASGSTGHHPYR